MPSYASKKSRCYKPNRTLRVFSKNYFRHLVSFRKEKTSLKDFEFFLQHQLILFRQHFVDHAFDFRLYNSDSEGFVFFETRCYVLRFLFFLFRKICYKRHQILKQRLVAEICDWDWDQNSSLKFLMSVFRIWDRHLKLAIREQDESHPNFNTHLKTTG